MMIQFFVTAVHLACQAHPSALEPMYSVTKQATTMKTMRCIAEQFRLTTTGESLGAARRPCAAKINRKVKTN